MTTILLVDDHKLVRQAVKRALTDNGYDVVGEGGDGEEGVRLVNELNPNIVMLDITMPVMDGIAALKIIKSSHPDTRVIMLTMHGESAVVNQAINSGASAFMTKDSPMAEVIDIVHKVAQGELISPSIAKQMLDTGTSLTPGPHELPEAESGILTKRETEILQLIADGRSTNDVGNDLFISVKTVKNHLASIYDKLDARDRTQAVLLGLRTGIIEIR
ncbi:MAG TPA: response regulator transcription factor [Acidimicrobiia bacterium]|nr:response regulator transcription factor [Acidimicrobiia bacterium]